MTNIATPEGRERVRHMDGHLNITQEERYANIRSSITRGLEQVRGYAANDMEICLVGSGPSLAATADEIRTLKSVGCPVVAMNGSYQWLLEHDIVPTSMVLIDGREFNARFITERLNNCSYFLASQCHPAAFDKVKGLRTFLWHCLTGADPVERKILDDYYLGCWQYVLGGCTIGTRAIILFRLLGFQSMHLFGMDSCFMDGEGHVLPQPENDHDEKHDIICGGRSFLCSAWHQEQALEFVDIIAEHGHHFQLSVHGNGLLAHILEVGAAAGGEEIESQMRVEQEGTYEHAKGD